MNCILDAFGLFKANGCAAATLAVMAFAVGAVAGLLICKLFSRSCCGANRQDKEAARRPVQGGQKPFEKRKPHPAPADGSVEIYIGNLNYEMTEPQLLAEFEKFGKVNSVRLVMNRFTGKSKGFGFVQMPVRAEAEAACAALNDSEIMGRRIKCNEAKNLI